MAVSETYGERVAYYAEGAAALTAAYMDLVTEWLVQYARVVGEHIIAAAPQYMEMFATSSTFDTASRTLVTGHIIGVYRGNESNSDSLVACRRIPPSLKGPARLAGSLEYATSWSPVYYVEAETVYMVPTPVEGKGNTIIEVVFPSSITYESTSVTNYPDSLIEAVILRTACALLNYQILALTEPVWASSGDFEWSDYQAQLKTFAVTDEDIELASGQIAAMNAEIAKMDSDTRIWAERIRVLAERKLYLMNMYQIELSRFLGDGK